MVSTWNAAESSGRCAVPASPELKARLRAARAALSEARPADSGLPRVLLGSEPRRPGLNDGLIIPGSYYPLGTSVDRVRRAAAERAPLTGTVRVIVVLVNFTDQDFGAAHNVAHFNDLFFSTGVIPTGSVREYYTAASHGIVDLQGQVVGPYEMPQTMAAYANGASGIGMALPNARTMARDAAQAANPDVDYSIYDNDGNGFVDAFVVVHAGPGAEQTGNAGDIWSHKWVLAGGEYAVDNTKIYAYLTVPEDSRIGVCAHELGHLLFGWPDLYDTDYTSEGIGDWCLMAGGSWNGGGDTPAHPSAWCKADQGWVSVVVQTTNAVVPVADVKDAPHIVHRLWKDGAPGTEYFLVENRQRTGFDAQLPGDGLLVWHVDEAIATNSDETHYKVALMQADGLKQLENDVNQGDGGDPFPGAVNNTAFTNTSNPNSKSYGGLNTCVSVTSIGASGPVISARLAVKCKTMIKEGKEPFKDRIKEFVKDRVKDQIKDQIKEPFKEWVKEISEKPVADKRPEKPEIDKYQAYDKPGAGEKIEDKFRDKPADGWPGRPGGGGELAGLEVRVAALEAALAAAGVPAAQPFIGEDLRPDLSQGALLYEEDLRAAIEQLAAGDAEAKRNFDSKTPDT